MKKLFAVLITLLMVVGICFSQGKYKINPYTGLMDYYEPAAGGSTHNFLSATHLDVTAASVILGDLIYGGTGPTWLRLPGNITVTKKFLRQTGTGAVSAAPAWDTVVEYTDALARAALSSTATGLTYTSGTGVFSLTANYVIPTATEETNWNTAFGWGNWAHTTLAGYGITDGAPYSAHFLTDQAEGGLSAEVVVSANGKSLVTATDYAAMKALLDLEIGTDVQAQNAVLTELTALTDPGADRYVFWNDTTNNFEFTSPSGGAPADAPYLTSTAVAGLSAEVNLGALGSGLLKHTVAGGVSTPAVSAILSEITNGVRVTGASSHYAEITHDGTNAYVNVDMGAFIIQKAGGSGAGTVDISDGSSNYLTLTAGAIASDYTWTFTGGANSLQLASGTTTVLFSASSTINQSLQTTDGPTFDHMHISKGTYYTEIDDGNSSTADTIDFSAGPAHKSTATGDCTYTFTAPPSPCSLILRVVGDGTQRTMTWPNTVKWPAATAPTITLTNGAITLIGFYFDGTNYWGGATLDIR